MTEKLCHYLDLTTRIIDQAERRVLRGESIPAHLSRFRRVLLYRQRSTGPASGNMCPRETKRPRGRPQHLDIEDLDKIL